MAAGIPLNDVAQLAQAGLDLFAIWETRDAWDEYNSKLTDASHDDYVWTSADELDPLAFRAAQKDLNTALDSALMLELISGIVGAAGALLGSGLLNVGQSE